jgi:hypothetical protein
MKTYIMPVELEIKFEAENEKEALSMLTFMKIETAFEEEKASRLLNVEEQWGELKVIK